MKKKVVTIDYGMSNTLSVVRALKYCGAEVRLSNKKEEILNADYLVLPGVGAFHEGMEEIKKRDLESPIKQYIESNKLFLGVCLGMQMLLEVSNEFEETTGLGIIEGQVEQLPKKSKTEKEIKIPHISWNKAMKYKDDSWNDPIFQNIKQDSYFYFVHSYFCKPKDIDRILAVTPFHDFLFPSIIKKNNAYGIQFHPEKSGEVGLQILKNFLEL